MSKKLTLHGLQLLVFAALLAVDQYTKWLVLAAERRGAAMPFWSLGGVLDIIVTRNHGAAFGMLQGGGIFFLIIAIIAAAVIGFILGKGYVKNPWGVWGMILIAAGALGNAVDRILHGYVVDMVRLLFINFAIFNAADVFISAGAGMMFIYLFFYYEKERGKKT
ncbi:MAG: signal peptidase II [Oscillospiraceae bacterium]|nr:signal peptidase II [Oscillospiraceae bacterium]